MVDALLQLQASVTKTSTFSGAALDLKTGTPRRGMKARLLITAASGTSPTFDGTVEHSDSSGSGFTTLATFAQKTTTGEDAISFETSKRYVRFTATLAAGSGSPSFTYQVDLMLARP